MTRRAALAALLLVGIPGLAGAAQPVQLQKSGTASEFRKLIFDGRLPAPLNAQQVSERKVGDLLVQKVRFTSEPGEDAVAVIYRPSAAGRYPVILVQHFLGGTKDHVLFGPLMAGLAQRGYLVAAIDGRHRGERQRGKTLEAAMVDSLRTGKGKPFLLDTVFDITRLLDYLQERPDVDPARMGMTGMSEGGIITWMTAVADPRVRVAVPIIGVTCFGEALAQAEGPDVAARLKTFDAVLKEFAVQLGEPAVNARVLRMAWERLVPGMLDRFDAPAMLPLIAPRPLLILAHEKDELFPLAGARKAFEATRKAYSEAGAPDRVAFQVAANQAHAGFDLAEISAMMSWFDRFLKPGKAQP